MTTNISSMYFWTDSTATIGWIQSKRRQDVYCHQIDQISRELQRRQLETHPWKEESRLSTQRQTPVIEVESFLTWSHLLNSARMVFQAIRQFKTKLRTRRQNESPETFNTDDFASDETREKSCYLITMAQNEFFPRNNFFTVEGKQY